MSRTDVKASKQHKEEIDVKNSTIYQKMIDMTPSEAMQYVEDNVTDFASAKRVLKILAAMAAYHATIIDKIRNK